ncbi:MAG TPA: S24/S26 family peptidase [Kineosporiaceae bacterium]|nr:S24/S26 family peptidase [Kineosporiaceae bacterium]
MPRFATPRASGVKGPGPDADHKGVDRSGRWDGVVYVLRLVALGYLSAAASLIFWSHVPQLVGWQPRVVLSGSMMPSIRPGDVALVAPVDTAPPVGHVVLVSDPGRASGYYLHRVVRLDDQGRVVTRGDANASDDWPAVELPRVKGELRLVVPVVGTPLLWWRDHDWLALALTGVTTWTALFLALGLLRRGPARRLGHAA